LFVASCGKKAPLRTPSSDRPPAGEGDWARDDGRGTDGRNSDWREEPPREEEESPESERN
jgi:predicted small lipoprotein YifL